MKKALLVVLAAVLVASGCTQPQNKNDQLSVDSAINEINSSFDKVDFTSTPSYELIGADDGAKIEVNSTTVEIYHFSGSRTKFRSFMDNLGIESSKVKNIGALSVIVHSESEGFRQKIFETVGN